MTTPIALPKPTAARARRARDQFDPTRLPRTGDEVQAGKTYAAALTKEIALALPFPATGRYYVKWTGNKGIALFVTRDRKTLYGRARGKSDGGWKLIGDLGDLLHAQGTFPAVARYATAFMASVARGDTDPTAERAAERAERIAGGRSVENVVMTYLATPTKFARPRAESSVIGLTASIRRFCGKRWNEPMRALCNPVVIADLFKTRCAKSAKDATRAIDALATLARRTREFRELGDAIADAYDLQGIVDAPRSSRECGYDIRYPSRVVQHWERVAREATTPNYRAMALRYYVSIFLPLRISTLSALRWSYLLEDENGGGMFRIPAHLFKQTNNMRNRRVVELPVSPRLYGLLREMQETARSPLIFPSANDPHKPMGAVEREFHAAYGIESTQWTGEAGRQDGRYCTIHDGRRLVGKLVASHRLAEKTALKGLLTHSHLHGDVTDLYIGEAPYWAVRELAHAYEAFVWQN